LTNHIIVKVKTIVNNVILYYNVFVRYLLKGA